MADIFDDKTLQLPTMEIKRKPGRPAKYQNAAERQRAYRQRLKEQGKVEVKRIMSKRIADDKPASSKLIDLSALKPWDRS